MKYGAQIGFKFHENGTAACYPGNTVIADVRPGNPAYDVMAACLRMLREAELSDLFICLPEDSYHMTVIRGVNDRVRSKQYWPEALDEGAPMKEADAYMRAAVERVAGIGNIRMRFDCAAITAEDFRIRLTPADGAQAQVLERYRDAVADSVGLRLPGHDAYRYHITPAYTWRLPDEVQAERIGKLADRMNEMLKVQGEVLLDPPHFAWYRDMLSFSDRPIERD